MRPVSALFGLGAVSDLSPYCCRADIGESNTGGLSGYAQPGLVVRANLKGGMGPALIAPMHATPR
jgi:hypothetical protein